MRATRIYLIVLVSFAGSIFGLVALSIVARFSGPEVLGVFAYWMAFAVTFGMPLSLDLETAHLKIYATSTDVASRARFLGAFALLKIVLILSAAGTLTLAVALGLQKYVQGEINEEYIVLGIVFASSVVACAASIPLATLAASNLTAKQQISTISGSLLKSSLLAVFGLLMLGAAFLGLAYLIGSLATIMVGVLFIRRYHVSFPRREDIRYYLNVGGPLMFAPIFTAALINVDKIVLGTYWSTSEVGVYFFVQSFAIALMFVGRAMRMVFIPGFSEDLRKGLRDKVESQSREAVRYINLIAVPSIVFIGLFSGPFFEFLLGSDYDVAGVYLAKRS